MVARSLVLGTREPEGEVVSRSFVLGTREPAGGGGCQVLSTGD